ncbi:hypothetical protein PISMIDRAFT_536300 [Pisolithus microcarpus 441]|uniref:Uncharacterized protein n=1 Tax=Pisolithus microcarpus 441 TaxID=765257 RepID=A0A0C9ZH03_9AGAM|nr:hypothetical protein PISMIDRAFT_536300 [Pisolithus microcarpus 441]
MFIGKRTHQGDIAIPHLRHVRYVYELPSKRDSTFLHVMYICHCTYTMLSCSAVCRIHAVSMLQCGM